ncbi:MAG TPA: SUMF1/EgtB/PvdO family nonheme iron enzyme, partial [Anaerovoracaceae bacterium]|nr:SUMF1/EgtB/PvdO family nonheme iron enzyme [Anaerovoracaceae bacterium]
DMHGNVWEFCADAWFEDYTGAAVDGSPRLHGKSPDRVARGGSWHETPAHCRSAVRLKVAEEDRLEYYGFQVMLKLV